MYAAAAEAAAAAAAAAYNWLGIVISNRIM